MENIGEIVSQMERVHELEVAASEFNNSVYKLPALHCKYDHPEIYEAEDSDLEAKRLQGEIVEQLKKAGHETVLEYLLKGIKAKRISGDEERFSYYILLGELCNENDTKAIEELEKSARTSLCRWLSRKPQYEPDAKGRNSAWRALTRIEERTKKETYQK